jgi:hypothetical protein
VLLVSSFVCRRCPHQTLKSVVAMGADGGVRVGATRGGGGGPLGWQRGGIQGHQGPVAAPRPHAATSSAAPAMTRAAACVEGGDMR